MSCSNLKFIAECYNRQLYRLNKEIQKKGADREKKIEKSPFFT